MHKFRSCFVLVVFISLALFPSKQRKNKKRIKEIEKDIFFGAYGKLKLHVRASVRYSIQSRQHDINRLGSSFVGDTIIIVHRRKPIFIATMCWWSCWLLNNFQSIHPIHCVWTHFCAKNMCNVWNHPGNRMNRAALFKRVFFLSPEFLASFVAKKRFLFHVMPSHFGCIRTAYERNKLWAACA